MNLGNISGIKKFINYFIKNNFFENKIVDSQDRKIIDIREQVIPQSNKSGADRLNTQQAFAQFIKTIEYPSNSSTAYKDLYQLCVDGQLNPLEQVFVYEKVVEQFRKIEFIRTPQAWVQKADLLDVIDFLVKENKNLEPLEIGQNFDASEWKEGTVPLVPYHNMKQVAEKLNAVGIEQLKGCQTDNLKQILNEDVVGEHTGTAKIIHKLTRKHVWFGGFLGILNRLITTGAGILYNLSHSESKILGKISTFSLDMDIQSIEVLADKIKTDEGKSSLNFYYRGPRHLFGTSIHNYKSINAWFKRDLTPVARAEYLNRVNWSENKLNGLYGATENDASRVVISNADARLRFHSIKEKEFGNPQELTGKVLNREAEGQSKIKKDDPSYYEEKYKFSSKNLLGRESDDTMIPQKLDHQLTKKFETRMAKIRTLEEELNEIKAHDSLTPMQEKTKIKKEKELVKLKKRVLKENPTQRVMNHAQHELLGGIYRVFDREGAVQVVQRLAPADIHNYVAPLNGTPLSNKEAILALKKKAEGLKFELNKRENVNAIEIAELENEIELYDELEEVFTNQETLLNRSSQATIDIYGTNASVSTTAIWNQSGILAQNDRKVMLFQHEDGNISLHVFIGATGVNRVDVDPLTDAKKQGDRQGDMQFGRDTYKENEKFLKARDKTTKDGLRKLKIGDRKGGFPINGSTVISYYLPTDFTMLKKVNKFNSVGAYGAEAERKTIEIKTKMGDPILVKTEIALVKGIEKLLGNDFKTVDPLNPFDYLKNMNLENREEGVDEEIFNLMKKLIDSSELSVPEFVLKQKVEDLIQKRLSILTR